MEPAPLLSDTDCWVNFEIQKIPEFTSGMASIISSGFQFDNGYRFCTVHTKRKVDTLRSIFSANLFTKETPLCIFFSIFLLILHQSSLKYLVFRREIQIPMGIIFAAINLKNIRDDYMMERPQIMYTIF